MSISVKVKGIREGLLITLGDGSWDDVKEALLSHLQAQNQFLQGAKLTLDVGNHALSASELGKLRDTMGDFNLTLKAVLSNSPKTQNTAQILGLGTRISKPHPDRISRPLNTEVDQEGEPGIIINRTLRSGYKVEYPGHITIIGDVNAGAEVISTGSVIIWGRLRGMVHAGMNGNEKAVVCALDFSPTQLRFAGQAVYLAKPPKKNQPQMAFLKNGEIATTPWLNK